MNDIIQAKLVDIEETDGAKILYADGMAVKPDHLLSKILFCRTYSQVGF